MSHRGTPRALALGLLAYLVLATPALGQERPPPRASLPDIENEVMCLVCGVTLDLATEARQAERERALIRRLIDRGKTKPEIKDRLVQEYGPGVLAEPGTDGFDLTAWIVPGGGLLAAVFGIGLGLRQWRRHTLARAAAEGGSAERPLDPADAERLDADLARYDL